MTDALENSKEEDQEMISEGHDNGRDTRQKENKKETSLKRTKSSLSFPTPKRRYIMSFLYTHTNPHQHIQPPPPQKKKNF